MLTESRATQAQALGGARCLMDYKGQVLAGIFSWNLTGSAGSS